jgi:hypothetical protein
MLAERLVAVDRIMNVPASVVLCDSGQRGDYPDVISKVSLPSVSLARRAAKCQDVGETLRCILCRRVVMRTRFVLA